MDISGLIQSYDSRATSSSTLSRTIMAPQYVPTLPYTTGAASNNLVAHHQQLQQNSFSFGSYAGGSQNVLVPVFANNTFFQQRPLPSLMQPGPSYGPRNGRQGFVEEIHSQSPPIKPEPQWNAATKSPSFMASNQKSITAAVPISGGNDVNFGTEVDTLMKAIQAKSKNRQSQTTSPVDQSGPEDDTNSSKNGKRRYHCTIKNCSKYFCQKTHLDIHERCHTGLKPYLCKDPECDRSFSQLGNLKTHERRHTGERPFPCEICGKRFAQRGNVRAHRIVHNQTKPYLCRLDDCGKQFTQLGNLKSHQNKFHIDTIRALTTKFASVEDDDAVDAADKELWEYFAILYKNSNKGIKGRGKDRKVGSNSMGMSSRMRGLGVAGNGGYSINGTGRGNVVVGVMNSGHMEGGIVAGRGASGQYEMYDVDEESQSGSHSGSGSGDSVGTCFDDAPSDGYEDSARGTDLTFGDRIY